MKGKHVKTSQYATEVFEPTGRNIESAEVRACLTCPYPECVETLKRACPVMEELRKAKENEK